MEQLDRIAEAMVQETLEVIEVDVDQLVALAEGGVAFARNLVEAVLLYVDHDAQDGTAVDLWHATRSYSLGVA